MLSIKEKGKKKGKMTLKHYSEGLRFCSIFIERVFTRKFIRNIINISKGLAFELNNLKGYKSNTI